jgi:hypothetical protein
MIRFFVTGPGRSGSQMLWMALAQHPEIHASGEIFLPERFERDYLPSGKLTIDDILAALPRPEGKKIFGFSVLYNELYRSRYTTGLVAELAKSNFRVIHVVRNNLLRRFISNQVALRTNLWADTRGNSPSTVKVTLGAADLFLDIRRTLARAETTRRVFGQLPFLEISYEDLCIDFSGQLARICKFLGASPESLAPKTFKQDNRPMREAVTNYDQMKLLFSLTKYRRFFEE